MSDSLVVPYHYYVCERVIGLLNNITSYLIQHVTDLKHLHTRKCNSKKNQENHMYYLVLKWYIYQYGIQPTEILIPIIHFEYYKSETLTKSVMDTNTETETETETEGKMEDKDNGKSDDEWQEVSRGKSKMGSSIGESDMEMANEQNDFRIALRQLEFDICHTICEKFVLTNGIKLYLSKEISQARREILSAKNQRFAEYCQREYSLTYNRITEKIEYLELGRENIVKKWIPMPMPLFEKMCRLLGLSGGVIGEKERLDAIFSTMMNYEIFGGHKNSISLSTDVIYKNRKMIDKLATKGHRLDVEAFASPVNSNLPVFCSLFPDIEYRFGSIGSFYQLRKNHPLWKVSNYVVCNPPYDELIMTRMAQHILDILENNSEIGFIVTIPDWRPGVNDESYSNVAYRTYDMLKNNHYFMFEVLYVGRNYKYMDYFRYEKRTIGKTGTIMLVLKTKDLDCPLVPEDFRIGGWQ